MNACSVETKSWSTLNELCSQHCHGNVSIPLTCLFMCGMLCLWYVMLAWPYYFTVFTRGAKTEFDCQTECVLFVGCHMIKARTIFCSVMNQIWQLFNETNTNKNEKSIWQFVVFVLCVPPGQPMPTTGVNFTPQLTQQHITFLMEPFKTARFSWQFAIISLIWVHFCILWNSMGFMFIIGLDYVKSGVLCEVSVSYYN